MADDLSAPRRPLHERSNSQSNSQGIRLVPSTPPQLLGQATRTNNVDATSLSPAAGVRPTFLRDEIYSRTPLPTHPSHILLSPSKGKTRSPFVTNFWTPPVLDESFHATSTSQVAPQSTGPTHSLLQPARNAPPATPSPSTKPKAPAKKRLQIHKDGRTFSLLRDDSQQAADDARSLSPILSPASRTSFDSLPSYASNTEPRTSEISASSVDDEDSTLTTIPCTPPSEAQSKPSFDPVESSPWNYSLVGGVRKVPKTPDLKQKSVVSSESPLPALPPLPPVPEASDVLPSASYDLSTKQSFQSENTASTFSESSNYKVYRTNSTTSTAAASEAQPSSEPNYQILQESSSETSVIYRPQPLTSDSEEWEASNLSRSSSVVAGRTQTSGSEPNYEIHGDPSPSASFLEIALPSQYSQESLVVPALKPRARRSNERLGYYKSRSRESLRSRTGSLTSISTVLSQREALRAIVSNGFLVNLPTSSKGPNSWAEPSGNYPQRSYMNEHPHQWSSQLSTVLSVSDGGSERNSRSWSDATGGRSRGPSRNSRAIYSIGSSSFAPEDLRSRNDWPETPQPTHTRNGQRHLSTSSVRMIESQDEYGDGITDLQDLRSRPSRSRLSGFYSIGGSENGRTNTMRSTSSSRSNSLLANSIPAWAMLYYGSGERRYLGAPGSSTEGTDSRANSFRSRSRSPNTDHFPLSLYSPRRRPRDLGPHPGRRIPTGSMEITPLPDQQDEGVIENRYTTRFRTWSMSSVWSPHLRVDRRAMRQSVWEPPLTSWSTEGGYFGRRNVQILMFITGFIFPFAWMIAAVLPLPSWPLKEMQDRDSSTSNLGVSNDNFNDYERQFGPMDEARYESAQWWRRLNRWMSLVGALIIAAVIILVVITYCNSDKIPIAPTIPTLLTKSASSAALAFNHPPRLCSAIGLYKYVVARRPAIWAIEAESLTSTIMPERADITYFGAGPALLPTSVLETASQNLLNFQNTGLGLAEHSHRSEIATNILNTAKADLASYLDIPDNYEILFMQGGGSGQFSATVYNLVGIWVERRRQNILREAGIGNGKEIAEELVLKELQKAVEEELKIDYLVTGSWSLKASQEAARLIGKEYVNVAADARTVNDGKFGKIPEENTWKLSNNPAMVYYCDNETVDGVEFPGFPDILSPRGEDEAPIVVADMSSNILSRRIPIKNFSVIFFGAQKNLGSTGITVVIIKKSLLPPLVPVTPPTLLRKLGLPIGPVVLSYETIAKNNSLYNTLSIFDLHIAGEVLKSLLATFPDKVDGQQALANKKAQLIYDALDAHPETYRVVPSKSARSRMNVCFRVLQFATTENGSFSMRTDVDEAEASFLNGAKERGLLGVKGHRSVGGMRASNYNSIPLSGAEKLAEFLHDFAKST